MEPNASCDNPRIGQRNEAVIRFVDVFPSRAAEATRELERLMHQFDSFDLLANLSLTGLYFDPEKYNEAGQLHGDAFVEFAALLCLKAPYQTGDGLVTSAYSEIWARLHNIVNQTAMYFGAKHMILRHIRESPKTMVPKSGWFRARENKEHGFGPAPSEHVSDQRYNTSGQSRWYFADSAEAAVAEVSQKGAAWVQAFDAGALDGLLDLRAWRADDERALTEDGDYRCPHNLLVVALVYGDLLTQRHAGDDEARRWKPEYLVSRFIAEAATAAGFNGIAGDTMTARMLSKRRSGTLKFQCLTEEEWEQRFR